LSSRASKRHARRQRVTQPCAIRVALRPPITIQSSSKAYNFERFEDEDTCYIRKPDTRYPRLPLSDLDEIAAELTDLAATANDLAARRKEGNSTTRLAFSLAEAISDP
jgi:hypothetical protein